MRVSSELWNLHSFRTLLAMGTKPLGIILSLRLLLVALTVMLGFDWLVTHMGLAYNLSPVISGDLGAIAVLLLAGFYATYRLLRRLLG